MLASGVPVWTLAIPVLLVAVTVAVLLRARRAGTLAGPLWRLQAVAALLVAAVVGCSFALWIR